MGIAGATILITARDNSANPSDVVWGDILIIINAVSYTFYFILVKPLMKNYNPVTVIRMIFTIGLFFILPFCWKEFTEIPWKTYTLQEYIILATIVLGGTFCAYLFNLYGIKKLGASIAGAYIYSQPFFAAAIAMIFLNEPLSMYKLLAAAFIFTGVYLATKSTANA